MNIPKVIQQTQNAHLHKARKLQEANSFILLDLDSYEICG